MKKLVSRTNFPKFSLQNLKMSIINLQLFLSPMENKISEYSIKIVNIRLIEGPELAMVQIEQCKVSKLGWCPGTTGTTPGSATVF